MQINSFKTPKEIVYGWGAIEHLQKIRANRVAIFTDRKPMEKHGFLKRARDCVEQGGALSMVAPDISREPTSEDISRTLEWTQQLDPDMIVALGGGSVIDVAKTVRSILSRPTFKPGELTKLLESPRNEEKVVPLVAIPTTSGTGSEVTPYVVFVDPNLKLKRVLVSDELMPDTAIIDPEVSSTMPPSITANTGFDALSHGLESYVCTASNNFTEPLALRAIQLIFGNLERAHDDGMDRNAREKVHYASTLAGIAIANSAGGLAHRMDQIGPQFGLPHGLVLAILQPYVMQYNSRMAQAKYAEIAKTLGIQGGSDEELFNGLIKRTEELRSNLGIPATLREAGIRESELQSKVDMLSQDALAGLSAKFNPRKLEFEEVKKVFHYAFSGEVINF